MSVTTPEYTEEQLAEIYMRRHIQMIIPQFAHAFQMAIIQPIVARFREKTARSDTIFDLIESHKKMVAKLETAIFFEETPVIGKQVLKIMKIAKGKLSVNLNSFHQCVPAFKRPRGIIRDKSKLMKFSDFERQHREKSKREDFVRTCANLRTLTKSIHEQIENERMGLLFQGMSEVLYYTDSNDKLRFTCEYFFSSK